MYPAGVLVALPYITYKSEFGRYGDMSYFEHTS